MSEKRQDVMLPGNTIAINVTEEQAEFLNARKAFVEKYCGKRGWDILNLSITQILEIRNQPKWKEPL